MITLPCFDIIVVLDDEGGGSIASDLHLNDAEEGTDDWCREQAHNMRMDAIETMILSHAVDGIEITTTAYVEGIQKAVWNRNYPARGME